MAKTERFIAISHRAMETVADSDGDGFPEIAVSVSSKLIVVDLQDPSPACPTWPDASGPPTTNATRVPPTISCSADTHCSSLESDTVCNETTSQCICLHYGWRQTIEDDGSRATASAALDFDTDGSSEIVYQDECSLLFYQGLDGLAWFSEDSESRVRIEGPVVADFDFDSNAEVIFAVNHDSGACSVANTAVYNNGIEAWGERRRTGHSTKKLESTVLPRNQCDGRHDDSRVRVGQLACK